MWATVAALLPLLLAVKAHNCHGGGKDGIATVAYHSCPRSAYVYSAHGFNVYTNGSKSFEKMPLSLFDDRSTYMFKVENGLSAYQTVHVSGKANKKFQAFAVSFLLGKPVFNQGNFTVGTVADHHLNKIALQVRVDSDKERPRIEVNFLLDGKTQDGLQKDPKAYYNILKPDQPFDIRIEVNLYAFEVFFNEMRLGLLPHVVPHCAITYVNVDGDVELTRLQIDKGEEKHNLQDCPTQDPIPGGHLNIGDRVFFYGRVTNNNYYHFAIYFTDAKYKEVFQFLPDNKYQDVIILGTIGNKEWIMQKEKGFPFDVKKEFKVEFVNEKANIAIYIDDKYHSTYAHRVNAETDYQYFWITGTVQVHRIEICRD